MARRDWYIDLQPAKGQNEESGGHLDVICGDEQDAIEMLEYWASVIEARGSVPRGLDWQSEPVCGITRRLGRRVFQVRCDSFERETDNGSTNGLGYLRAREAY